MQGLNTQLHGFCFANLVIACCSATAVAATSVFLGSLTPMEAGRLTQRLLKYLFLKVVLIGMVVLPQQLAMLHWLPWLAAIGELKMFVGLSKDRLSSLSVTPAAGLSHRARTLCLLLVILAAHALCMTVLWVAQLRQLSWAVCVLFGLDLAITAVDAAKATVSCVALLMDEALAATTAVELPSTLYSRTLAVWERWQGQKREAVFYRLELGADVAMHTLTLVHHVHVWVLHGLSFNLLDALLLLDTRAVVLSILQRLRLHKHHTTATSNIDSAFPDAPKVLLADQDAECVICRDRLTSAKQLPCGHMFHLSCLRAWLQQSGGSNFTCPMCRTPLPLPCAPSAAAGGAAHSGTANPVNQHQWQLRQQQQHTELQLGHSAQPASAGSEFMRRISFSLSLDELPGATGSAQYRQQLQLYERADSWGDDALQQGMLDSPASDMGLQDDLARALAASLQDTGGPATSANSQTLSLSTENGSTADMEVRRGSSSSGGGTKSGSNTVISEDAQLSCSGSSTSSSNSPANSPASISTQHGGAVQLSVPLPPAIFQAAAAAVAAGALDTTEASDRLTGHHVQQQYTLDSGVVASSSSYAWLDADDLSDAAERFYSQQYGDPLADSDAAATAARSPGLAAASRVCHTCSRMLVSLISRSPSRSPSPRSSTSDPGGAPAAAAVVTTSASAPLHSSASAPLHTPSGTAAIENDVPLDSRASDRASCSGHSSKRKSPCRRCHQQRHSKPQQHCEQQDTPCQARGSCKPQSHDADASSASKGYQQHLNKHRNHCSCSCRQAGTAELQPQIDQEATTVAGATWRKRVLLEKYAGLRVDIALLPDQADSAATTAGMSAAADTTAPAEPVVDGREGPNGGGLASVVNSAAAAAVLKLITSPREPHRRREEGRWGRRRLLRS